MTPTTLSSKGQLTIPRQLCVNLGLAAGAWLQAKWLPTGGWCWCPLTGPPPNRKTCLAIGRL